MEDKKMLPSKKKDWIARTEGILLIPHELLHILGYRLMGVSCKYQWGNPYVTPLGSISRWKRLVGILFPFIIFFSLLTISGILAGLSYKQAVLGNSAFFWPFFWIAVAHIACLYAGSTLFDLRKAYLLLVDKPWHSWTPFDMFCWPLIDWSEVRRKKEEEAEHF